MRLPHRIVHYPARAYRLFQRHFALFGEFCRFEMGQQKILSHPAVPTPIYPLGKYICFPGGKNDEKRETLSGIAYCGWSV